LGDVAQTFISDFQFNCPECGEDHTVSYEHLEGVLPKFETVECPDCGHVDYDPPSPDPIGSRPKEPVEEKKAAG